MAENKLISSLGRNRSKIILTLHYAYLMNNLLFKSCHNFPKKLCRMTVYLFLVTVLNPFFPCSLKILFLPDSYKPFLATCRLTMLYEHVSCHHCRYKNFNLNYLYHFLQNCKKEKSPKKICPYHIRKQNIFEII